MRRGGWKTASFSCRIRKQCYALGAVARSHYKQQGQEARNKKQEARSKKQEARKQQEEQENEEDEEEEDPSFTSSRFRK